MTFWPVDARVALPDGRPTPEFAMLLQMLEVKFVEVEDESEIPDPPDPNTFYFERV